MPNVTNESPEVVVIKPPQPETQASNISLLSNLYWVIPAIIIVIGIFIIFRRKFSRKEGVKIKLIRFLNNDVLTIQDYLVKSLEGLRAIRFGRKRWIITEDNHPKTLMIEKKHFPCYIIHDAIAHPLDVNIREKEIATKENPEIVERLTEQSALERLLRPKFETPTKQVLLYVILGLIAGIGIGIVIGSFIPR